ncbi:MAG TPA: patatin-like phospholipase family protein [Saprospiraceae bacterium]|nr:patatin-like phospholipase family protein [Saprospiraceae bacterium]
MRQILTGIFLCCIFLSIQAQTPATRPKIGLALSGGGAKGLAHIGILKAIDSAGLKIDYITGTSMGSIVGGLYALGYSSDSIEKLARNLEWDVLLTNKTSLRAMIMEEKEEYGKYALELQLTDKGLQLPTGVLEGEEMWLKLHEMFAPAYNITDFNKLPVPFRCIGTEVSSGNPVVLDHGNLISSIRASMAIPSVFTAVDIDGCTLVDGGIVRNFPVQDVQEMGADYVIGSSVSSGLLPQEKLTDAASILMQVIFLPDGLQHQEQAKRCDIYIEHPMDNYSAGSFGKAGEIIDVGIEQGRLIYPRLKHLADSLKTIYGPPDLSARRLPKADSVYISAYEVRGLNRTDEEYFTKMMGFDPGRYYDVTQLAQRVRNVFGTRYYNRVLYSLEPLPDGTTKVIFDVDENALTQVKMALHYNSFSNISLIANLTTRNLFMPASRSLITMAISENFRIRGEHLQQFGKNNRMAVVGGAQFESFGFTIYQKFTPSGSQRQTFFKGELKTQFSTDRRWTLGAGWRYEWIKYKPSIEAAFDLKGDNNLQSAFGYMAYNTLDAAVFPKSGLKMTAEAGYLFHQKPELTLLVDGEPVANTDSIGIVESSFPRFTFNSEWYKPLSSRTTLLLQGQIGLNFNYTQIILNDFAIGGLQRQFRNQITFAGLQEATVNTPSVAALSLGVRYEIFNNLFGTLRVDGLAHNFISRREEMQAPDFLSGTALTLGYNTPIGPLELSVMYSPDTGKVGTYINFGLAF